MQNEVVFQGAAEIARLIRSGEVSPLEVIQAHIDQIERVNPKINALVTPAFEQALKAARAAGERLAKHRDWLPPLFGVPVTIKDALPVAGLRFTAGSIYYQNNVAQADAEAVRRLKAAGAIILGKTNCADLCGAAETDNLIFGLTRNPWNLARSAGGSSGGEAALIAARGSPLGLGSDLAGSVRIPAAFCGIASLKPTGGRVATSGHVPPVPDSIRDWNTVGPLARRVEDLALALSVLSDTPTRDFRSIDLQNTQVFVPAFLSVAPVSREVAAALNPAADALRDCGIKVVQRAKFPLMRVALEYSARLYRDWLPLFRRLLGNGKPARLIPELLAHLRGKGRISPATLAFLALMDNTGPLLIAMGFGRKGRLEALRRQILAQVGSHNLILWPVFPSVAPPHGFSWRPNSSPIYTGIFNSLGFPSVAAPAGLSGKKLPLSVQIVASPGNDEIALAAASVIEQALGGCLIPPIVQNTSQDEKGWFH